jgi:uncharacterized protein (TIRG00374 family)
LGALVGALALAWAVRGLDWRSTLNALTTAQYMWVVVSLLCVFAVALIKTVRWGALYRISKQPTLFSDLFSALMIAQMVNVVIPIRIGEVIRIGLMKQSGQPGATTLSTIAIEKAIDLVAAGLLAVAVVVRAAAPGWLQNWAGSVLLLGVTLVVGLALVWYLRRWIKLLLTRTLRVATGGWLAERWQARLLGIAGTMLDAFGALTTWTILVRTLFWTVLAWSVSLLCLLALFVAFGLQLPLTAAVVLMLSLNFSNIVPSPPALVGIMQAIVVVVLGGYGVPQPIALGLGIVLNVITVSPLILLGSLGLGQRAVSWMQLLRKSPSADLWRRRA